MISIRGLDEGAAEEPLLRDGGVGVAGVEGDVGGLEGERTRARLAGEADAECGLFEGPAGVDAAGAARETGEDIVGFDGVQGRNDAGDGVLQLAEADVLDAGHVYGLEGARAVVAEGLEGVFGRAAELAVTAEEVVAEERAVEVA